jgi:GTP-binding protein HflX
VIFNKIDAYHFIEQDPFDLTPPTKKNITLEELEKTWIAKINNPSVFISATRKSNIDALKTILWREIRDIAAKRYPENLNKAV